LIYLLLNLDDKELCTGLNMNDVRYIDIEIDFLNLKPTAGCNYLKQEMEDIYRVIAVIMSIHSNLMSYFLHVMSLYYKNFVNL